MNMAWRRSIVGARLFATEASPKTTISDRVKRDGKGMFGVAASTLAFILSAQSFRMRNERNEAIERLEALEATLSKVDRGVAGREALGSDDEESAAQAAAAAAAAAGPKKAVSFV